MRSSSLCTVFCTTLCALSVACAPSPSAIGAAPPASSSTARGVARLAESGAGDQAASASAAPTSQEAAAPGAAPGDSSKQMVYTLRGDSAEWPEDKRRRVVEAMNAAVALYNQMGEFPKQVTAGYNAGTPTADGSYNGNIRFGGSISKRVALHELGHVLGAGTHPRWESLVVNGVWMGPHAQAQLRAFDGPDAVLHADRQHFWPYGLNFDKESSPENDRRHVLMVAALRRDLGITGSLSGQPIRGMVGVGTWNTQAEFKDIRVTKGTSTLLNGLPPLAAWKTRRGSWQVLEGALRQSGAEEGTLALVGEPGWSDYTLSLKARKISGAEGFLIAFGSPGDDTKIWWNLGGWNNTQHAIELPGVEPAPIAGKIEAGRWYDIRVELSGPSVKCFLDGKLIQQATR